MSDKTPIGDGGPAFPRPDERNGEIGIREGHDGMSLLDFFAAAALGNPELCNGCADNWTLEHWFGKDAACITRQQIATRQAYEYAYAMLRARAGKVSDG